MRWEGTSCRLGTTRSGAASGEARSTCTLITTAWEN
jgi:hypothetical protein